MKINVENVIYQFICVDLCFGGEYLVVNEFFNWQNRKGKLEA